ncbi:uncharacterized protein LOC115748365 [Rhodamnia argentea]|uniref:Uncharacterized protein LOC115748365 n=1 Tax=Rhodamnia argentea TaxID=178133 RepID=A0A8B8Q0T0_9MYRT|nr:uncharacterized protein LOC115748365 [Rhodamnia argentea]
MIPTTTTMAGPAVCRTDSMESSGGGYSCSYSHRMMEKRQLFLRSYQFSRKRSLSERIRRSLRRVKRVVWFRLRSARRFRRLVWAKLCRSVRLHVRGHGCSGLCYCNGKRGGRRRRSNFLRLLNPSSSHNSSCDSCFW